MHRYYAKCYAHKTTKENCMALIKINADVFDITTRLKEIDNNYFIVYNTNLKRYEVHNSGQYLDTFCLTVDGKLNCLVIDKVLKTRRQNIAKLLKQIEQNNKKLENEKQRKFKDELHFKLTDSYSYLQNHDNLNDAYKTRFV